MKILINTTTLNKGGALQVAVSFINEIIANNDNSIEFHLSCSKELLNQLQEFHESIPLNIYMFENSPANPISRRKIIRKLNQIVFEKQIDVVFTIFGPSYWRPKVTHICGFADGWCYNPDTIAYKTLNLIERIKMKLRVKYKLYFLEKTSDFIIIETADAKKKLANVTRFTNEHIFVVGNSYDKNVYENTTLDKIGFDFTFDKKKTIVLTLSAYYPHKNLEIIAKVAKLYREKENVLFVLTIDKTIFEEKFSQATNIINLGPVKVVDCPSLYQLSDIVLQPSLLETFSANFPEAMFMKKPIITTNLSFSRDICGDAAIYYDPTDSVDLYQKLNSLIGDKELSQKLINNGLSRLKHFTHSDERAKEYIMIIKQLCKRN